MEAVKQSNNYFPRFTLPDYVLDFGYVIHGKVPTHIVKVTNTGPCQVSFRADRRLLAGTGLSDVSLGHGFYHGCCKCIA